ncbi:hypothetical protein V8F06_014162 [Rhypophila decipiens]
MAFRLECIPPEVRLKIYREMLICNYTAFRIRPEEADPDKTIAYKESSFNKRFRSQISPNCWLQFNVKTSEVVKSRTQITLHEAYCCGRLLCVVISSCRGVYLEAIDILYSENKFLTASPSALIKFLKKTGKNAQCLRTLTLRLICRSRAMTWLNAIRKLANMTTGLLRLQLDLMESREMQLCGLNFVFGFEPLMLQGFGHALGKMRALETVVVTGARGYSLDWSIYFPTMTKAVEAPARKLSPWGYSYPFDMGSHGTMGYHNTFFTALNFVKAYRVIRDIPISNSDYYKLVDCFENAVSEVPDNGARIAGRLILKLPRGPREESAYPKYAGV